MITTYAGYDVFAPEIGAPEQAQIVNRFVTQGDFHNAREAYITKETDTIFSIEVYQDNAVDRQTLKDFFKSKKGKLTPFWYISPIPVGRLLQSVSSGTTVTMENTSKLYKLLSQEMFLYFDATSVVSKVVSIAPKFNAEFGSHEEITLTDAILNLTSKDSFVYLMMFVRFDQDTLSIDYDNYKTSSSKLVLKELHAELKSLAL